MKNFRDNVYSSAGAQKIKEADTSYGSNPLFWIGVAVLVCLVVLAAVSVLDLKRDAQATLPADGATPAAFPFQQSALAGRSFCPNCGSQGIAQCFNCGRVMNWNPNMRSFLCHGCGRAGLPQCPRCRVQMTGGNVSFQGQRAVQNIAFAPPPACATCPSLNQCFPQAAQSPGGAQPAAFTPRGGCPTGPGAYPQTIYP